MGRLYYRKLEDATAVNANLFMDIRPMDQAVPKTILRTFRTQIWHHRLLYSRNNPKFCPVSAYAKGAPISRLIITRLRIITFIMMTQYH